MNIKYFDPRNFLRWQVIKDTMFVEDQIIIKTELDEIQKSSLWKIKWKDLIKENNYGNPPLFKDYPSSSGNSIHHTYHIYRYENFTNTNIIDSDLIFEFGFY